ncbi:YigZ family protein [uncultured Thiothrix sp.]|uniref:YigZ family protein n=1 Tax=uncultured Thiothrix sp. TaxID=223185 RepID=UPI002604BCFC|nr:YigZ family protein [uncultured Thiothrix sp.]
MSSFLIPAGSTCYEQTIKNSRFISHIAHAPSPHAAHTFITHIRQEYPDARHVCWAFVAGKPKQTTEVSCSDDGEPAGTAGKPMLNVLLHSEIGELVAVVVRYFGGIKLGTGGLVRAYSSSVTAALKQTPTCLKVARQGFILIAPYALEDSIRRLLNDLNGELASVEYAAELQINGFCPISAQTQLQQALADLGRGQIVVEFLRE